jgi:putative Mg2+ transporter-C (MgtC) family protein
MNGAPYEFLQLPEFASVAGIVIRLVVAAVLGGLIGVEREWVGKAAGLRTHMLVSLGAALFILAPAEIGLTQRELGSIIQGIAVGIGFVGAGSILKRSDREEIQGLTTAASIWLTAAIGVAAAVAPLWLPVISAVLALVILNVLGAMERRMSDTPPKG